MELSSSEPGSPIPNPEGAMPQPKKAAAPTSGPGLPAGHANMPKMLDEHPLDVDDLEDRYLKRMEELAQAEQKIFEDFGSWQRLFDAWIATTVQHENERSHKRLKTRVAFLQDEEMSLQAKKQHYAKVLKAFESALAMLR